jgi:hypothetical protein
MVCPYFEVSYVGYCNASELPYIPGISELEMQCFRNFRECPIYNKFKVTNDLVAKTVK